MSTAVHVSALTCLASLPLVCCRTVNRSVAVSFRRVVFCFHCLFLKMSPLGCVRWSSSALWIWIWKAAAGTRHRRSPWKEVAEHGLKGMSSDTEQVLQTRVCRSTNVFCCSGWRAFRSVELLYQGSLWWSSPDVPEDTIINTNTRKHTHTLTHPPTSHKGFHNSSSSDEDNDDKVNN